MGSLFGVGQAVAISIIRRCFSRSAAGNAGSPVERIVVVAFGVDDFKRWSAAVRESRPWGIIVVTEVVDDVPEWIAEDNALAAIAESTACPFGDDVKSAAILVGECGQVRDNKTVGTRCEGCAREGVGGKGVAIAEA